MCGVHALPYGCSRLPAVSLLPLLLACANGCGPQSEIALRVTLQKAMRPGPKGQREIALPVLRLTNSSRQGLWVSDVHPELVHLWVTFTLVEARSQRTLDDDFPFGPAAPRYVHMPEERCLLLGPRSTVGQCLRLPLLADRRYQTILHVGISATAWPDSPGGRKRQEEHRLEGEFVFNGYIPASHYRAREADRLIVPPPGLEETE